MAFLSGIFRKPESQQAQQQPAQQQATQQQQQAPANGNGSAGPVKTQQTPANPNANPQAMVGATGGNEPAGGPINPLDTYVNYFTPKAPDPKAAKPLTMDDPILGALDPAAFKQTLSTANFTAGIAPEQVQKALGGDTQAFMDVINSATREAFAAAAQLSHGLVEQGVRTGAGRLAGSLDSRIRDYSIRSQNTSNEQLRHPAVVPVLNAVKAQIAMADPNLSPEQVQSRAEQYFSQMAEVVMAPTQAEAAAAAAKAPKGTDFSSYITG